MKRILETYKLPKISTSEAVYYCNQNKTIFLLPYSYASKGATDIIVSIEEDITLKIWDQCFDLEPAMRALYARHGTIYIPWGHMEIWQIYKYFSNYTYSPIYNGIIMELLRQLGYYKSLEEMEDEIIYGNLNITYHRLINYIVKCGSDKIRNKLLATFNNPKISLTYTGYLPEFICYLNGYIITHAYNWLYHNKLQQSDSIILIVVKRISELKLWHLVKVEDSGVDMERPADGIENISPMMKMCQNVNILQEVTMRVMDGMLGASGVDCDMTDIGEISID
jgi:glycosyltransferase involved in cell wall biosynthesis